MAPSSRDRLSVDLHGLKAVLLQRSLAAGVSPSAFVRTVLADALGESSALEADGSVPRQIRVKNDRVRICLRMNRDHARAVAEAARRAGLSPGDYIGGLTDNVQVLSYGASRADHIAALTASSAELSTLSRNLHRLNVLLRQADVEAAKPYRDRRSRASIGKLRRASIAPGASGCAQWRCPGAGHQPH